MVFPPDKNCVYIYQNLYATRGTSLRKLRITAHFLSPLGEQISTTPIDWCPNTKWWIRAAALFVFVRQRSLIFCGGSSASRQEMQSESQMLVR